MAVIPSLAVMAALTLFHNGYGEGSVEDYWEPYAAPATRIQKTIRSYLVRTRALLGDLTVRSWSTVYPSGGRFEFLYRDNPVHRRREQFWGPLANRATRMHGARLKYKFPTTAQWRDRPLYPMVR